MAETVTIKGNTKDGIPLEATFNPTKGMNLISYKKGDIEVIDQSTASLFTERNAGLGALIGPHFHHRNPSTLSPIAEKDLFPHFKINREKEVKEPFSHGIARYVPWAFEAKENGISAIISGKDEWKGVPLSDLEGQDFTMTYDAAIAGEGLNIKVTVQSDSDSLVGLHYYYALPQGKGTVIADVKKSYREDGKEKALRSEWSVDDQQIMRFDLANEADYNFQPYANPCVGNIVLDAGDWRLRTRYRSTNEENSWQLYHPAGASFVCIEPLSAANPRKPILTVSAFDVDLLIE